MHSQNERNQTLLAAYYLDLLERQQTLKSAYEHLLRRLEETGIRPDPSSVSSPVLGHVDLPYVGSTEAATNMRQSVENKSALMARFRHLLEGQLDSFPFDRPANVIYGAGGFSGILAGLVTTRQVEQRFSEQGGEIQQIYGISAGVLNGFFHAVQVAAKRYPDLYRPAAHSALKDLEDFIAHLTPRQIARINLNPIEFWQGWANLQPLASFLADRLSAYTGSSYPMQITFDDIGLPFTVAAARLDGYTDFLGISHLDRRMFFGNCDWTVRPAPIVQAMLAGWSMNTYIIPTRIREQSYTDGGGTFYDPALFVACFDPQLINLLNIHLDEPDGHSYNLPPRPNLLRILFDTHNYIFPEERRRMRFLSDLLYQHYALRHQYLVLLNAAQTANIQDVVPLPDDFRRNWQPDTWFINPPPILPSKEKR